MRADWIKEKIEDKARQEGRQQRDKECQEWAESNNIDIPAGSPPPWETMGDTTDKETKQQQ